VAYSHHSSGSLPSMARILRLTQGPQVQVDRPASTAHDPPSDRSLSVAPQREQVSGDGGTGPG